MKNYEAKKPSYFATPSPQLIHALHTALKQILAEQSPKNAVDLRVEMGWHRDSLTADRGDCRFATA